jgi:hypothetical protein
VRHCRSLLLYLPQSYQRQQPLTREYIVRVEEIDQRPLAQHELLVLRCELEAKRHALA